MKHLKLIPILFTLLFSVMLFSCEDDQGTETNTGTTETTTSETIVEDGKKYMQDLGSSVASGKKEYQEGEAKIKIERKDPPEPPAGAGHVQMSVSQGATGLKMDIVFVHHETYGVYPLMKGRINYDDENWSKERLDEAFLAAHNLIHTWYGEYELPGNNVFWCISSGFEAMVEKEGLMDHYEANLKGNGTAYQGSRYYYKIFNVKEEAQAGILIAAPPKDRDGLLWCDLGGSNGKFMYDGQSSECIYGSKTLEGASQGDLLDALNKTFDGLPETASDARIMGWYGGGPFLGLCAVYPQMRTAQKYELPSVDFTLEDLDKAIANVSDDNFWKEFEAAPGVPAFYSQDQVLNALTIMRRACAKMGLATRFRFYNQDLDWAAGYAANEILKREGVL